MFSMRRRWTLHLIPLTSLHHIELASRSYTNLLSKMLRSTARISNLPCKSQRLMVENGVIQLSTTGIFHMLPLGLRAQDKLTYLIDMEMKAVGGQKLSMPCLSPGLLWKATDRWSTQHDELMKLSDRHNIEYTLGPTHEEVVTNLLAAQGVLSYKQLPLRLYQIGRKFRDESRPHNGLLRAREFVMKDMYTFDTDELSSMTTYNLICAAYSNLFDRLGVTHFKVLGTSGNIGGTLSHEFHIPAEVGEDSIYYCHSCNEGVNVSVTGESNDLDTCPQCQATRRQYKAIEVAHTFFLGTKYSKVFMASFKDATNKPELMVMGCYGIGVGRLLAASIELLSSSEDQCIRWPKLIAPYQVIIIPPKKGSKEEKDSASNHAEDIYTALDSLPNLRNEIVLDDRVEETIGYRIKDDRRLGYPYVVIIGKRSLEDVPIFELEDTQNGETYFLTHEQLVDRLSRVETVPVS